MLEAEFTEEEIYERLKFCNSDKAPGPDGFNMKFLQEFWHAMKGDVMELFNELHHAGKFVKSLNTTFLVRIAKNVGGQGY